MTIVSDRAAVSKPAGGGGGGGGGGGAASEAAASFLSGLGGGGDEHASGRGSRDRDRDRDRYSSTSSQQCSGVRLCFVITVRITCAMRRWARAPVDRVSDRCTLGLISHVCASDTVICYSQPV